MNSRLFITLATLLMLTGISAKAEVKNLAPTRGGDTTFEKGDINEDGEVNAADVVALVDIIMKKGSTNDEATDPNSLIGKWNYTRIKNGKDYSGSYTFRTDGKCDFKNTNDAYTYTYQTQGDFLILSQDLTEIYVYELDNGVMEWWIVGECRNNEDINKKINEANVSQIKAGTPYRTFNKEI